MKFEIYYFDILYSGIIGLLLFIAVQAIPALRKRVPTKVKWLVLVFPFCMALSGGRIVKLHDMPAQNQITSQMMTLKTFEDSEAATEFKASLPPKESEEEYQRKLAEAIAAERQKNKELTK